MVRAKKENDLKEIIESQEVRKRCKISRGKNSANEHAPYFIFVASRHASRCSSFFL